MNYYSLNDRTIRVSFKEAAISGQAKDKGLYFPESIPQLDKDVLNKIEHLSHEEIAFRTIRPYVSDTIPREHLYDIVKETINFPFPLVKVKENVYALELFHGPTLAFKDVGARFMSRCLRYFIQSDPHAFKNKKVTVLVATSGDTGGAVADGFYDVEGIDVVILFPSGKVSSVQEKQLTALGNNIHALEVNGTFDDCQAMVKQAFADATLSNLYLTSANSINVARWLPQQFYYLFAYKQWKQLGIEKPVIAVPSGNFGNICAGLMAYASGIPAGRFIAACNANDVVPRFMQTHQYEPAKAVATLSNAMDVGDPSNFVRVLEIFNGEVPRLKDVVTAQSISDETTRATIRDLYQNEHYTADPHGAVAFAALSNSLNPGETGIFLETAHPVKFIEPLEEILGTKIPLPQSLAALMQKESKSTKCGANYNELKDYLQSL